MSRSPQNRCMPSIRLLTVVLVLCFGCLHAAIAETDYPEPVKTIVEQRCMVCHGCYDAPCQLKLDAWAGLVRGANKNKVYDGTRLLTAQMTRLFVDAQTPQQWREKGFYPVLDADAPEQGVLYRMLALKQQHPLPPEGVLPDSFDFSLDRKQQCPKPDEFERYASDYPLWGMPYGLPAIDPDQHQQLTDWLQAGSPGVQRKPLPAAALAAIQGWESFFNGRSLKQQLMARYIYEHLFVADLYFPSLGNETGYFNLVRSRTPPGEPVDMIATRRPYDPPGTDTFYYRLVPLRTSVLVKRHMPYALNDARMLRWQALFLDADYKVGKLPSYKIKVASNPFVAFRELPVKSRYEFMLDEAQFTIMAFIKGPVCRGQVALSVIDDHFWVVFSNPDIIDADQNAEFLARESDNMRLPAGKSGLLVSLVEWRKYARGQSKYLKAKSKFMARHAGAAPTLDMIWNGGGHNDNAALTVFRHFDSASVVKGLVGQTPKTAWVIGYSLLERIHYLLVAGFDVYGNVAHQLETRLYMDFLRMEGEYNFLIFMPQDKRIELRDFWYREASADVKQYVLGRKAYYDSDTGIQYRTDEPRGEFFDLLKQRLPGASAPRYQPAGPEFGKLQTLSGKPFSLMPEVAFVNVFAADGTDQIYSIIHNGAYLNNAQLFQDTQRRVPVEDYLTVVKGFVGSYPNIFFQLPAAELADFVKAIETLNDEQDYAALVSRYGVRRNAPWFWKVSDKFHAYYQQHQPIEAGLFDLNRYENR
jgi:Fatty acid cis/trans isomerase (CTI)